MAAKPFDELASGHGAIRSHWNGLMAALRAIPAAELADKSARARAKFAEADEFLAIYGDASNRNGWSFDVVPLIIPAREWADLSAGVVQRARLLDRILRDLYRGQRLIANRSIPPYLVQANPEFLRSMRHLPGPARRPFIPVYAVDLVRDPDGTWRVISDRTQAPAGVGYALRHRRLLARSLPELFRGANIRRLEPFFAVCQASLLEVARDPSSAPRVVLLTPGPYNENYYEHVFLARELGLTLAQGSDLMVRDRRVLLKTLDGPLPVDVIYRRVDGAYCDPLELREDSTLGVAGLLGVMRAGRVAIINLPGSAVVETPALAAFLPALARRELGEDLKLPSLLTWWCGEPAAQAEVLASPDDYVLRPVFSPYAPTALPGKMTPERQQMLERLRTAPETVVAQRHVPFGVAPSLVNGKLEPLPIVVRLLAVWHEGDWMVMPGGVARVQQPDALYQTPLHLGGITKDVWVEADETSDVRIPAAATRAPKVLRATGAMRSRVADDLFWLGRHVERIDLGARLLRPTLTRLTSGGLGARDSAELLHLAQALCLTGWITNDLARTPVASRSFAEGIAAAATGGNVLFSSLTAIRTLSFSVRDRLSLDLWRTLSRLQTQARQSLGRSRHDLDQILEGLDDLVRYVAAVSGLAAENMTRGMAWRFLDIGRRIERTIATAMALAGVLDSQPRQIEIGLHLALEICDSTITYRSRYPTEPRLMPALDLVLADPGNPRALGFQLAQLFDHVAQVMPGGGRNESTRQIADLIAAIELFVAQAGKFGDEAVDLSALGALLRRVGSDVMTVSDAITQTFFTHIIATTTQPYGTSWPS